MGSWIPCCSIIDEHSRFIEYKMKEDENHERGLTKLLFLGPGGSGKSTIFTQLQWLHGNGFNEKDALLLGRRIHEHMITQMQDAIKHYLTKETQDTTLKSAIDKVTQYNTAVTITNIPDDISDAITYIWQNDDRLKDIFNIYHTKHVLDETTEYFWNDMDRITAPDYIPNEKDLIYLRNRTTGIIQKKFDYKNLRFHVFDVGGQKSERKKWIQCFDEVKAIIFVVSLTCYNQVMFENSNINCMVDALELFEKIINDDRFSTTPIILFLNKTDLFKKKIKEIPMTECPAFDDFEVNNGADYDKCIEYVKEQFEAMNSKRRQIFVYPTCAMDADNVQRVFEAATTIILKQIRNNMRTEAGL